jgi:hypothetical protein
MQLAAEYELLFELTVTDEGGFNVTKKDDEAPNDFAVFATALGYRTAIFQNIKATEEKVVAIVWIDFKSLVVGIIFASLLWATVFFC